MKKQQFKLESLYQDLCHRYGADDPTAQAMQQAITAHEAKMAEMQAADRRDSTHCGHVWDRATDTEVRLH